MLSVFPDLFTYGLLGPFILRVVLGFVFLDLGYLNLGDEKRRWADIFEVIRLRPSAFFAKVFGFVQMLGGILLIIGLFTQVVALIFAIVSLAEIWIEYREPAILKRNIVFYILIGAISISLLFLGAGAFAFDLPL